MIYLQAEHVAKFNAAFAGAGGIRDIGLIESACGRPQATALGEDAYATIWEKAAALLQSLACNHGFTDGNKRTAWISAVVFLEINDHPLKPSLDTDAAEALVLAVATGGMRDVAAIAGRLAKFCR